MPEGWLICAYLSEIRVMNKKEVREISNIKNKRVLVVCDFNISLKDGRIANDTRITEALPTINFLLKNHCRVILVSHLGRPKGRDLRFSLKPVADRLERLAGVKVELINDFLQEHNRQKIKFMPENSLILLENIRFYPEEKANDPHFAQSLSQLADIFINDAFGASHRVHASIVGISRFLPGFAGILLSKEINMLDGALKRPKRPLIIFIGGAKTPEKISVIEKLLDIADTIALGGAIANTFLAAWGYGMGLSLVDYEMVEMARVVFWQATRKHCALLLPTEVVISNSSNLKDKIKIVGYDQVPPNVAIFDIGSGTNRHYRELINTAGTIIWNGPMGYYENPLFQKGTNRLLKDIADSKAFKIIGGGDTLTCLNNKKILAKIDYVSTGGSAMLEFMKEGTLPGIEVLLDK